MILKKSTQTTIRQNAKKKKNPKENYQVSKRMKTSLVVEIKKIFGAFAMDLEG